MATFAVPATAPIEMETAAEVALVGIVSLSIGWTFRRSALRSRALELDLHRTAEQQRRDLSDERTRIADELHDVIAHDLTIIAMHANLLQLSRDKKTREDSRKAISSSAKAALADIRKILNLIHGNDTLNDPADARPTLMDVLNAMRRELETMGIRVESHVNASIVLRPPLDSLLSNVAREAVTNIAKHARDPALVEFRLQCTQTRVTLEISNMLHSCRPEDQRSPGMYGLSRMEQRILAMHGTFTAGIDGNKWVVGASVPFFRPDVMSSSFQQ